MRWGSSRQYGRLAGEGTWYLHFAWLPVQLTGSDRWVWLECVQRRELHNPRGIFYGVEFRDVPRA